MSFYEEVVMRSQIMSMRGFGAFGGSDSCQLSNREPLSYEDQVKLFAKKVREADRVIVGGASGLSAAGGGDFYYEDNASYRKYFGKFAEKYGFKGAFDGMFSNRFPNREEHWGYVATFLNTTITAPLRQPYLDLDRILKGKDFFVITTNQDTQFMKIYPEEKVAELQGDHRFFQCARCCRDYTWDSVEHVKKMMEAMGEGTSVPSELIPRCPFCNGEAFPWVRGYGNFLEGSKYKEQYEKASKYILDNQDRKILFIELGVGRLTPMFIQEPFWFLAERLDDASYIGVNNKYDLMPKSLEGKGFTMVADIGDVLRDVAVTMEAEE